MTDSSRKILEEFGLADLYAELNTKKISRSYRNFIKHIPGDLATEKQAPAESSLSALVRGIDFSEFNFNTVQNYDTFTDLELRESFGFLDGPVPPEKRLARKKKLTKEERDAKRKRKAEKRQLREQRRKDQVLGIRLS